MLYYRDLHFICYMGAPKWLPESFEFQVWFWLPGSSLQYQKELEQQRQKQIPKGLLSRILNIYRELLSPEPYLFSELWPLGSSRVLHEIEECDGHEEQIVQGLSRQQIKTRKVAIKQLLLGRRAEFDFGRRLRQLGSHWIR